MLDFTTKANKRYYKVVAALVGFKGMASVIRKWGSFFITKRGKCITK